MNVMLKPTGSELVLTRELKAPRERVFAAWVDVKQASLWWAPRDFTPLSCEMDVRPGGAWRRRMRSPRGDVILKHGIYREIMVPERLVFTYITENAAGIVDPETLVSLSFVDLGDGLTRLTLWHSRFETEAARDDHRGGWTGGLERLADFIEKT
ncbi:MAG: SRPBCC domain-containing protein [Rhodospirillales bacterium]|nr:SRPBCC domain-containing protein [Rhodospirillales bacterium]